MASKPQQVTNTALYVLPVMVGNLVPIVTLPILTRLLSAEDFGAWALANAFATVVGGLAAAGLPVAYDRNFFEQRDPVRRSQLLHSVVAFSVVSFVVCGLGTWLVREPVSIWLIGTTGYQTLLVWSFAATAVAGIKNYYMTFLKNSEQAAAFSALTIAERLLSAVLSIVLIAWMSTGVLGLVISQLVGSLMVVVIVAVRALGSTWPSVDRRLLWDSLAIGYPLMPRILFGAIGSNVDKYLIGQMASLGGVGIYSLGQRVATIAFTYMTALQNVFGPQVYTWMFSGDSKAGAAIGRYLTPFAYGSTVLSFLIALFSEEILTVLAPANFHGAIPIVTILALYYAILFFGKMPQIAYARKTYIISLLGAASTVLSLVFGVAGIAWLGAIGAAWGALLTGIVITGLTFVIGQRCFRIEWEVRKLQAVFGLLFASALLTIALRLLGVPYVLLLLGKATAVAVFVWLGVRLQILTRENAVLVRDLVSSRFKRA